MSCLQHAIPSTLLPPPHPKPRKGRYTRVFRKPQAFLYTQSAIFLLFFFLFMLSLFG